MGFNTPNTDSSNSVFTAIVNQIHVDGTNVKVTPAGTPPSVVYRIGDGTVHPDGFENTDGFRYLDFYVSTGAQGAKGDKGEDGLSAYEQAVQGGYSGTQEEFYTLITEVTSNAVLAEESAIAAAISETNAENFATASQASATNSAASALASANSATESSGYATNSSNSATASSNSASSASTSASAASNSAASALNSANAATTSETNAALSELASATSETNAASSAAIALASKEFVDTSLTTVQPNGNTAQENINIVATDIVDVNTIASNMTDITYFADVYQGAKAVAPTLRNDGSALAAGDLYFNTVGNAMFVYDGSVWGETGSAINGVEKSEEFIATGGQTLFTLASGYDVGFVNVFREGMLLGESEYTADNGSTVTLNVACIAGDIVKVQAFGAFTLANTYTIAQTDAGFVSKTSSTGSAVMPSGTEAQRDVTPIAGYFRFNSDANEFEGYNGTEWGAIGGGAIDDLWRENAQVVTTDYTVLAGRNASIIGDITVNDGITITVENGARLVII